MGAGQTGAGMDKYGSHEPAFQVVTGIRNTPVRGVATVREILLDHRSTRRGRVAKTGIAATGGSTATPRRSPRSPPHPERRARGGGASSRRRVPAVLRETGGRGMREINHPLAMVRGNPEIMQHSAVRRSSRRCVRGLCLNVFVLRSEAATIRFHTQIESIPMDAGHPGKRGCGIAQALPERSGRDDGNREDRGERQKVSIAGHQGVSPAC